MSTRKTTLFYAILIAVASVAVGMVIASRLDLAPASGAQTVNVPATNSAPLTGAIDASTFRNIAKSQIPTVVNIRTEARARTRELTEFFGGNDDLFERFFGQPRQPQNRNPRQRPRDEGLDAGGRHRLHHRQGRLHPHQQPRRRRARTSSGSACSTAAATKTTPPRWSAATR